MNPYEIVCEMHDTGCWRGCEACPIAPECPAIKQGDRADEEYIEAKNALARDWLGRQKDQAELAL